MNSELLSIRAVRSILGAARRRRILVIGDVMLDQFIRGRVSRISPEAPVPVVEFERESFMPGGAANVARNLTALGAATELFSVTGRDVTADQLRQLLKENRVGCAGMIGVEGRMTTRKVRLIAHQQQVARVDRESREPLDPQATRQLMAAIRRRLNGADGVIVGDYGKGVISRVLMEPLRTLCRQKGLWLSYDPKPSSEPDLAGLSLITPNRKEAFEVAGLPDTGREEMPLKDPGLLAVADRLLRRYRPALLLITLGDQGMLLCQLGRNPFHIPTAAREVFDVSGAGDTVIASFTLAIACGASPVEAAVFSNQAAGVVVGKVGTATVTPRELVASFTARS